MSEAPLLEAKDLRKEFSVSAGVHADAHRGPAERVLSRSDHPYTQALLAAVPQVPA